MDPWPPEANSFNLRWYTDKCFFKWIHELHGRRRKTYLLVNKMMLKKTLFYSFAAALCYLLPSFHHSLLFTLPLYFYFLLRISENQSLKAAFYCGLLTGFIVSGVHLRFFTNIFSQAAITLWLIIAVWTASFTVLSSYLRRKLSLKQFTFVAPLLYFLLEYTNCELYPLKFSWLSAGYLFHESSLKFLLPVTGIYGLSLILFWGVSFSTLSQYQFKILTAISLLIFGASIIKSTPTVGSNKGPLITGIQMEFPDEQVVFTELDKALKAHPETDLFMLSEYTFLEGIPDEAYQWCRNNNKYLLAGAKIYLEDQQEKTLFNNCAIVINPQGKLEFSQTKSVPIQFFSDGLPAIEQKLWHSPWGKIGLCICYDLSYTRVIDNLVELGAEALLVPTMDVIDWGLNQHQLHSRVAPIRAAEYGLPIFKVSSSGFSQSVNSRGLIIASAPYPGQNEIISSRLNIKEQGSRPLDRWLFFPALIFFIFCLLSTFRKKLKS